MRAALILGSLLLALHASLPATAESFFSGQPLDATAAPVAAAIEGYLRAMDVETGEEPWKTHRPAGGRATPMTYRLQKDGRLFVVAPRLESICHPNCDRVRSGGRRVRSARG